MNRPAVSQQDVLESGLAYFDLQAYIGTTKHMGGLAATDELAALCGIDGDTCVLDLGCGVGATACYLARTLGARVVGIDLRQPMVVQARQRARREGLESLVEFRTADARALPFQDDRFGATMAESVLSFVPDKRPVLREAARVTRPAGCVGFNEEIWLKPPQARLVEFVSRAWDVEPLDLAEWTRLLAAAGLRDIVVEPHTVSAWREASQIKRYHLSDLARMAYRTLSLYLKRPAFRSYMAERRNVPGDLFDYLGYALLVGRT